MNQESENPFGIRTNEKYEYVITLGDQLASKKTFKDMNEAEKYIESKPWGLIVMLAIGVVHSINKTKEEENNQTGKQS